MASDSTANIIPKLLTPPEAAEALAVSPRTLWGLTKAGQIPAVRINTLVRYDPQDLCRFVAERKAAGHDS